MKQSSIDSSSSSARRRSLAFLASAITMGSIADQQAAGDDRASPRNLSSSSLDLHRPSTAIGTVSPAVAGASSESKPGLAPPIGEPLHKPLSSGLPTVESPTEDARPSPMRNPNRPRLVAKGATREDAVPSALTEFLKMDAATPGGNGRAKVHKTAAAMYADAYRSSSDEDGPDIQKPASRQPDRSAPKRKGKEEDTEHAVARHKGKAPSGRRGSADHRSGMSNLSRAESGRSTAGSSEAKRSALSVSPKASRAAVKGTFSAAPAGPSMGGYVSPFYVAPLTSVDGGIGSRSSRPTGRRASASSRSIASDESKSVKSAWSGSGPQASRKGSQRAGSSKTSKKAPGDVDAASQDLESAARRTKSHTNLKAAAKEAEGTEPSHGRTAADRPPEPEEAATSSSALQARRPSLGIPAPSKASGASLTAAAAAPVSPSQNRSRSASSSSMFGQRLFRRPRTAGGDMSAHPVPSLQDPQAAEPSQRAASYDLLASPTDSIEFEMLDTSAKTLDVSRPQRGNSIGDVGRLSHDVPRAPNELTASGDREPRGRSNSIASIDVRNVGGRGGSNYGRASSDAYGADRASGDAVDRRGFSPSRLESSGGAANLFGGGGAPRQRTSSLLPTFGFGRTRTSSNAGAGSATPGGGRSGARSPEFGHDGSSSVAGLPAHESGPKSFAAALAGIAAGESLAQGGGGMRRKSSFRALTGSRKGSASGPGGEFKARNNSTSLHPEEYVPRTSRDSGDESRSAGRASISSTRRSSSSRTSFQRRPSSRNHDSATDLDSPGNAVAKRPPKETAPLSDESPEEYAERIADTVPKTEIAAVLASSADPFYTAALRHHMTIFWFNGNALDIALRKLLMDLHLPKETQQIDRVMEAFAKRYNECNDGLFASDDQPYILSFSLMMLHTDAFNKNAKHKMTKADYLRNTGPSGVPTEILEYLYDNLTFTQFIYVEDKDDLQRRANEAALGLSAFPGGSGGGNGAGIGGPSLYSAGATASQVARARIDPYYLIAQGKLGELRADIDHLIPEDTPFSYTGTLAGFDIDRLNAAFLHAPSIEIATGRSAATAAAPAAPPPSHWIGLEAAAHMQLHQPPPPPTQQPDEVVSLKVTKVGVVSRKDDVGDGGRKAASRKWKTCGLLLTGSQLLLFKDIVWTTALQSQILDQVGHSQLSNGIGPSGPDDAEPVEGGVVISPRITYFRPDGVISLADAVAVKDNTYVKYDFVFRLLASKGRQYLIQAQNEDDMNDWIHKINFCACFRTCDLKIRGLDLSSRASFAEAAASSSLGRRDSRSQARRPSAASEARSFASEGFKLSHSSTFSSMSDIDSQLGPDSGSTLSRPRSSAAMAAAAARPLSPTTTATPGADEDRDEDREELDEQGDEAYRSLSPDSRSRASSRASSSHIMPLLQKRLAARRELMLQKIEETGVALKKVTDVLDEELRLARHFAVLTPFQKMTRDRIEAAALPLSRKIKQLRLELAKEESRVRILKLDLAAGERLARSAVPSLRLSTSFVNDAKRAPGSQLATPQLLELSGMSETQAGFEDMFGSPPSTATGSGTGTSTAVATPTAATRSFDPEVTSPIEAAGRARLAQSQRRPSSDASAAAAGGSNAPPSHGTLPSSRITKPAHQQRHLTNLNSVSEQPADESPVLASAPRLGGPDDSFASSKPSDADADAEGDLASADATDVTDVTDADDEDDDGRLDAGGARREADRGGDRRQSSLPVEAKEATEGSVSPSRSSVSRSSASFEARRGDVSTDSLPVEADEEVPEEWDMSRLARDGGNRISLVDLPSPGELQEATTRRFIFGVSESSTVG
ncbi:uncharacterized protein PFL1_00290 [Pseudozyma flocculosa PF-1]|nr:uncharacterized protein PFL1_00290 [Pseudozyma flocculosa PF-1]EPQ32093.1 hypothetical protein PFL1_00290 [Pseudozyma flocculosa PF-1]